jgi:molecular chaperone GrpE
MTEQDAQDDAAENDDAAGVDDEHDAGSAESTDSAAETEPAGDAETETAPEEGAEQAVAEELVEHVAEADPEEIAMEIAGLETEIDGLEGELETKDEEIDELTSKLKRKQADFQNYKKRMEERREEASQRATQELLTRLLEVRDNLTRALDQDEDTDIRGGVESTLRLFDDILDEEEVTVIEPEPGADVDPHRHEVLVQVESEEPAGAVADVHRPGYEMGETVLREAQVTVSEE